MDVKMVKDRERYPTVVSSKSKTEQAHIGSTNINAIITKMRRTGTVPATSAQPMFGDFTNVGDYTECRNRVMEAQKIFDLLPSSVRARFANNPEKIIEFLSSEENRPEAEKLGLVLPRKEVPETPEQTETPQTP